jgi:hypothetical protein
VSRNEGAKAKMARLQQRKENSCESCGDDAQLTTCGGCGSVLCKDCKIDHECVVEKGRKKGSR